MWLGGGGAFIRVEQVGDACAAAATVSAGLLVPPGLVAVLMDQRQPLPLLLHQAASGRCGRGNGESYQGLRKVKGRKGAIVPAYCCAKYESYWLRPSAAWLCPCRWLFSSSSCSSLGAAKLSCVRPVNAWVKAKACWLGSCVAKPAWLAGTPAPPLQPPFAAAAAAACLLPRAPPAAAATGMAYGLALGGSGLSNAEPSGCSLPPAALLLGP